MHPVEPMLERVRTCIGADPDLVRVLLNATSWVEANLAAELLTKSVSEKELVTLANVREVVKELPRCPVSMGVDFERLARIWELEREDSAWVRSFNDSVGSFSIVLLGDGNCCYDIVVRVDERTLMWMPRNRDDDFLNPEIVDLALERPAILGAVIELVEAMGLTFYPLFYMSLEDWRQEYACDVFDEVLQGFGAEIAADLARPASPAASIGAPVRSPAARRSGRSEPTFTWLG